MNKTAAAFAAILLTAVGRPRRQAVELAAHRAFYRLSLASASNESNMAGVEGAISFEIKDACDAWIVEQNYACDFSWPMAAISTMSTNMFPGNPRTGWNTASTSPVTNGRKPRRSADGPNWNRRRPGHGDLRSALQGQDRAVQGHGLSDRTYRYPVGKGRAGSAFDRHLLFDGSKVEAAAPVTTVVLASARPKARP